MSNKQQLLIVLLAVAVLGGVAWFLKQDPTVNRLNAALQADPELTAYPYYTFRVMEVEGDTAVLSSPRSAQVSVLQFFNIARPELDTSNPDTPVMIAAQKELAQVQEKAGERVKADGEIAAIRWEIDRDWFASHGVIIE